MVLPKNYVSIKEKEMEYVDGGGLSWWQKGLVITAIAVCGTALIAAIVTGSVAAVIAGWQI